jgi:hypothetical protein
MHEFFRNGLPELRLEPTGFALVFVGDHRSPAFNADCNCVCLSRHEYLSGFFPVQSRHALTQSFAAAASGH